MSKPKKVLKSLSELEVHQAIDLARVRIYQIVHNGQKERAFEPKKNTQLHRVWRANKLDIRQQTAWRRFLDHFYAAEGKSGKVCASYGEFRLTGEGEREYRPVAYENDAYKALDFLCNRYLTREEYALLDDLLREHLQVHNDFTLEMLGIIRTGYKGQEEARIAGTVTIQNLLTRLSGFYEQYSLSRAR